MKKSIVSALAIVFLLCLSPIVMAGGGPPSPNTATTPASSFGPDSDGTGWEDPTQSAILPYEEDSMTLEAETIKTPVTKTNSSIIVETTIRFIKSLIKHGQTRLWKLK